MQLSACSMDVITMVEAPSIPDGRKKRKFLIGGGVAVEGCLWRRVEHELLAQTLGAHFNGTTILRGALAREEKNASDPSLRQRCDLPVGSLKSRY